MSYRLVGGTPSLVSLLSWGQADLHCARAPGALVADEVAYARPMLKTISELASVGQLIPPGSVVLLIASGREGSKTASASAVVVAVVVLVPQLVLTLEVRIVAEFFVCWSA